MEPAMTVPILLRACCACMISTMILPVSALRQEPPARTADQRVFFDIAAQPLDAALTEYFRESGVQLLYDSQLAAGRRSATVKGNYTPREALRLLLRGTGLIARYSRANAAILASAERQAPDSQVPLGRVVVREQVPVARPSMVQRMQYYDQVESELRGLLRNDRRTHHLTFDVKASLRIAPEGRIEAIAFEGGNNGRIPAVIAAVLVGQQVSPPPSGIAQPLLLILRGKRRDAD